MFRSSLVQVKSGSGQVCFRLSGQVGFRSSRVQVKSGSSQVRFKSILVEEQAVILIVKLFIADLLMGWITCGMQ